jgi:hypothetical protein
MAELVGLLEKEESIVLLTLEDEPEDVQVQGETSIYTINLVNQTCTCPDFEVVRSKFPKGHLRRICTHLSGPLKVNAKSGTFENIVFGSLPFGLSPYDRFRFMGLADDKIALIFKHAERDWCDVIAPGRKGNYDFFGFSTIEERWSYHTSPNSEPEIRSVILQWLKAIELINQK